MEARLDMADRRRGMAARRPGTGVRRPHMVDRRRGTTGHRKGTAEADTRPAPLPHMAVAAVIPARRRAMAGADIPPDPLPHMVAAAVIPARRKAMVAAVILGRRRAMAEVAVIPDSRLRIELNPSGNHALPRQSRERAIEDSKLAQPESGKPGKRLDPSFSSTSERLYSARTALSTVSMSRS